MRKLLIAAIVLIAAASETAAAENRWTDVDALRYTREPTLALRLMVPYGLPAYAVKAVGELAKERAFTNGRLEKGERCLVMVYGAGQTLPNVLMDWTHFAALETEDYAVEQYLVRRATICNNWLLCKRAAGIAEAPTAPARPAIITPRLASRELELRDAPPGFREWVIHVWSLSRSTPEGRELLEQLVSNRPGRQSRDLGDRILEMAADGKVKRHPDPADFEAELYDADFEQARGKKIRRNGEDFTLPQNFGPGKAIPIRVSGSGPPNRADGYIAIPVGPEWNTPKIAVEFHAPFTHPFLYYPSLSRSLKTCGPATARRCGGTYDPTKPTVLSEQLRLPGVTHYHFVVQ